MEISVVKTKMMTSITNGISSDIIIDGRNLDAFEDFWASPTEIML